MILAAWIHLCFSAIANFTPHPLKLLLSPEDFENEGFSLAAGSICIKISVVTSHLFPS